MFEQKLSRSDFKPNGTVPKNVVENMGAEHRVINYINNWGVSNNYIVIGMPQVNRRVMGRYVMKELAIMPCPKLEVIFDLIDKDMNRFKKWLNEKHKSGELHKY